MVCNELDVVFVLVWFVDVCGMCREKVKECEFLFGVDL